MCATQIYSTGQSVSFVPTVVINKRESSFISLESHYLEQRITNNIPSTFFMKMSCVYMYYSFQASAFKTFSQLINLIFLFLILIFLILPTLS
jgi:uncharacterized membrane protein